MNHAKLHHAVCHHRPWSREEEQLLGTKSDRALARKFGRTTLAVATRRRQLGISLLKPWRLEDDKLLGLRPDGQVALLLKRPRYQVAYMRRWFWPFSRFCEKFLLENFISLKIKM